jgi:hypothetical protein
MKILIVGDMHVTDDRPVHRIDNYWETVVRKVSFILKTAVDRGAEIIASPGDVTDTPALSYSEFVTLVSTFKSILTPEIYFLCTFGQHDMRYRTRSNTALRALSSSIENFIILSGEVEYCKDGVHFFGCTYGEDPIDPPVQEKNVLLIHRMIIDQKLWKGQTGFEYSSIFLRQHLGYDLIVSGDNHSQFMSHTPGGRWLFNCGAVMRNKVDMIDHEPYIVLFDTETKIHEKIYIPIAPASKVFRMEKVFVEQERNEKLEAFVSGLSEQKEISLSFEDNLRKYLKDNNIEQSVTKIALRSFGRE